MAVFTASMCLRALRRQTLPARHRFSTTTLVEPGAAALLASDGGIDPAAALGDVPTASLRAVCLDVAAELRRGDASRLRRAREVQRACLSELEVRLNHAFDAGSLVGGEWFEAVGALVGALEAPTLDLGARLLASAADYDAARLPAYQRTPHATADDDTSFRAEEVLLRSAHLFPRDGPRLSPHRLGDAVIKHVDALTGAQPPQQTVVADGVSPSALQSIWHLVPMVRVFTHLVSAHAHHREPWYHRAAAGLLEAVEREPVLRSWGTKHAGEGTNAGFPSPVDRLLASGLLQSSVRPFAMHPRHGARALQTVDAAWVLAFGEGAVTALPRRARLLAIESALHAHAGMRASCPALMHVVSGEVDEAASDVLARAASICDGATAVDASESMAGALRTQLLLDLSHLCRIDRLQALAGGRSDAAARDLARTTARLLHVAAPGSSQRATAGVVGRELLRRQPGTRPLVMPAKEARAFVATGLTAWDEGLAEPMPSPHQHEASRDLLVTICERRDVQSAAWLLHAAACLSFKYHPLDVEACTSNARKLLMQVLAPFEFVGTQAVATWMAPGRSGSDALVKTLGWLQAYYLMSVAAGAAPVDPIALAPAPRAHEQQASDRAVVVNVPAPHTASRYRRAAGELPAWMARLVMAARLGTRAHRGSSDWQKAYSVTGGSNAAAAAAGAGAPLRMVSQTEAAVVEQVRRACSSMRLPLPVHDFHIVGLGLTVDVAWPDFMVALEYDGGSHFVPLPPGEQAQRIAGLLGLRPPWSAAAPHVSLVTKQLAYGPSTCGASTTRVMADLPARAALAKCGWKVITVTMHDLKLEEEEELGPAAGIATASIGTAVGATPSAGTSGSKIKRDTAVLRGPRLQALHALLEEKGLWSTLRERASGARVVNDDDHEEDDALALEGDRGGRPPARQQQAHNLSKQRRGYSAQPRMA